MRTLDVRICHNAEHQTQAKQSSQSLSLASGFASNMRISKVGLSKTKNNGFENQMKTLPSHLSTGGGQHQLAPDRNNGSLSLTGQNRVSAHEIGEG